MYKMYMTIRQARYSKEKFTRLDDKISEYQIRLLIKESNRG